MEKPIIQKNNIYHGDSYKLIKEIPDKSIDLIYTDIPYDFVGNGGGGAFGEKKRDYHKEYQNVSINTESQIINKNKRMNTDELKDIVFGIDWAILDEFIRIQPNIYIYIWCSKKQIPYLIDYYVNKHNCYFDILVWGKTNPIPTCNGTYLSDLEYCLLFRQAGTKIYGTYATKSKYYISALNVEDKKNYGHPTIKPIELVKRHIINSTTKESVVLDPFMGSGTTCVACKELGVNYIGFEINENYYNIANDRLNGFDQKGVMDLFTCDYEKGEDEND